jgi:hypothetical protein
MFDGKFVCTLTAIIVAVLAICNFENKNNMLVENFWMTGSRGVRSHPSTQAGSAEFKMSYPGQFRTSNQATNPAQAQMSKVALSQMTDGLATVGAGGNMGGAKEPFGFQVPPNFQANLSPRGAAESFSLGTRIKYNTPSYDRMAYQNPNREDYHNMVKENYSSGEGCPVPPANFKAARFGDPEANYALPSYKEQLQSVKPKESSLANAMSGNTMPMPMPTMVDSGAAQMVEGFTTGSGPALGGGVASEDSNPNVVQYNNLVYGLSKSRNTGLGCPIRGDVCQPQNNCNPGWFQTSLKPGVDTTQGAMQVIAPGGATAMDADRFRLNSMQGQPMQGGVNGGMGASQAELTAMSAISDVNIALVPSSFPSN